MIVRRVAVVLFGIVLAASVAWAQPTPGRIPRVGVLWAGPQSFAQPYVDAGLEALRALGWTEGQNVVIEYRFSPPTVTATAERIANLAATAEELARLKVDAIVAAEEIAPAFAAMVEDRVDGFVVVTDPLTWVTRREIVQLASRNRLVGVYELREYVDEGGLELVVSLKAAQRLGLAVPQSVAVRADHVIL